MRPGVFITGTDTNVGKTVVAAALMQRYRNVAPIRYWKPIQTGIELDNDTETVRNLGQCEAEEILDEGIRLPQPVSPHLAARLANQTIDLNQISELWKMQKPGAGWIIEGAGGVLVPLNGQQMMIDLIQLLQLPALVVARSTLGTINHTLLTLEALRHRSIQIAGIIMVGPSDEENQAAITDFGQVAVLGQLPPIAPLTSAALSEWAKNRLDTDSLLLEFLR